MTFSTLPYQWQLDADREALSQMPCPQTDSTAQSQMGTSYIDHAWPQSTQGCFQNFSAPQSVPSTISKSPTFDGADWDLFCGDQPDVSSQLQPSDSYSTYDSGNYGNDDTRELYPSPSSTADTICTSPLASPNLFRTASFKDVNVNPPAIPDPTRPAQHEPPRSTHPTQPCKRGRPRKNRANSDPSSMNQQNRARRVPHNQVEKKYREGLNASLRQLQCAVPTLPQDTDSGGGGARPSKATVIAGAIKYIRAVEKERDEAVRKMEEKCGCGVK